MTFRSSIEIGHMFLDYLNEEVEEPSNSKAVSHSKAHPRASRMARSLLKTSRGGRAMKRNRVDVVFPGNLGSVAKICLPTLLGVVCLTNFSKSVRRISWQKDGWGHLISDAHEWINEIPTVPIYFLAKPLPRLGKISGERRPY